MDNFLRQVEDIINDYEFETKTGSPHDKQALMEALEEAVDEYISNK